MSTPAPSGPQIVERLEQPYAAIRRSITMDTFGQIADRLLDV